MFEQLQNKFSKIFKTIKGHGKISDKNISDAIREIRIALLESDVNYQVVKTFIEKVKNSASGSKVFDSITPGQQFVKIVLDELKAFLTSEKSKLNLNNGSISTIVLTGLQGSGKTTTAAKLASFLKRENNKSSLLVGLDLQRPAAIEQLKVLAEDNDIDFYIDNKIKDPLSIYKNAIKKANELKIDIVILDTAGRLHIDEDLIKELQDIINISEPDEVIYIADGMSGQDAVNSSKIFSEKCKTTGCIITKMDGDSGGGVALSIKEVTSLPIKFIGTGEKNSNLEIFNAERIAKRILGLDDIIGLVEQAEKAIDKREIEDIQQKISEDKFDLNDFKKQLEQFDNLGSVNNMIKYIPKIKNLSNAQIDDKKVKWLKAIIDSMTKLERLKPSIINGSRKKRISRGCGRPVYEINQLLKQFKQMKLMMKKMNQGSFNKFPLKFR